MNCGKEIMEKQIFVVDLRELGYPSRNRLN
jgi:hypothetical protein